MDRMIQIRHAEFEDRFALARIIIDATFSAFHGRVPDSCLNSLGVEESAENWGKSLRAMPAAECLLVAEVEDSDLVGLILAGRDTEGVVRDTRISDRFSREITSLQVSPAWQRSGIGRSLIAAATELVLKNGGTNLMVRVLKENPNRAFYERLGAEEVGSQSYDWEGYETQELLFGWDDIRCLT